MLLESFFIGIISTIILFGGVYVPISMIIFLDKKYGELTAIIFSTFFIVLLLSIYGYIELNTWSSEKYCLDYSIVEVMQETEKVNEE